MFSICVLLLIPMCSALQHWKNEAQSFHEFNLTATTEAARTPKERVQAAGLQSGDAVYLQNPSHHNHYVECHDNAGAGYGVSTTINTNGEWHGEATTTFTISLWSGTGPISDGDEIYLQNPSHYNQYVECSGGAGEGYGVSTTSNKDGEWNGQPTTKFTIHKWSGTGPISDGDAIYLQNPSHYNQYVECHGTAGEGYGISTTSNKNGEWHGEPTTSFLVFLVVYPTPAPTPVPTPLPTPACTDCTGRVRASTEDATFNTDGLSQAGKSFCYERNSELQSSEEENVGICEQYWGEYVGSTDRYPCVYEEATESTPPRCHEGYPKFDKCCD